MNDGTEIDDAEVFQAVEKNECLVMLEKGKNWPGPNHDRLPCGILDVKQQSEKMLLIFIHKY